MKKIMSLITAVAMLIPSLYIGTVTTAQASSSVTVTANKTAQWTAQERSESYDLRVHGWSEWENAAYIGFTLPNDFSAEGLEKAEIAVNTTAANVGSSNSKNLANGKGLYIYSAVYSDFANGGQYEGDSEAPEYDETPIVTISDLTTVITGTGTTYLDVTDYIKNASGNIAFRIDVGEQNNNIGWAFDSLNNGGVAPKLVLAYEGGTETDEIKNSLIAYKADVVQPHRGVWGFSGSVSEKDDGAVGIDTSDTASAATKTFTEPVGGTGTVHLSFSWKTFVASDQGRKSVMVLAGDSNTEDIVFAVGGRGNPYSVGWAAGSQYQPESYSDKSSIPSAGYADNPKSDYYDFDLTINYDENTIIGTVSQNGETLKDISYTAEDDNIPSIKQIYARSLYGDAKQALKDFTIYSEEDDSEYLKSVVKVLADGEPIKDLSITITNDGAKTVYAEYDEESGGYIAGLSPDLGEHTVSIVSDDGSLDREINLTAGEMQIVSIAVQRVEEITFSQTEMTLTAGGKQSVIDADAAPYSAVYRTLVWTSDNEAVATVSDNGIVTPVSAGTAVITAAAENGVYAECAVTVEPKISAESIKLDRETLTMEHAGSTYTLNAELSEGANEEIIWSSSDESVARVKDGVVISVCDAENIEKSAVITAATESGKTAECLVTVKHSSNVITNDSFYKTTADDFLYSQGGGIYKFGDTYYWYGVQYKEASAYAVNPENGKYSTSTFEAFTCYSSTDLVNWRFEGYPLTEDSEGMTYDTDGEKAAGWVGRMGVAYNENTQKYVLISQKQNSADGYEIGTLFATSDTPAGPYTVEKIMSNNTDSDYPFPKASNGKTGTGDQTVFVDDDGKAYLICSNVSGRYILYVAELREEDYLGFGEVKTIYTGTKKQYIDENGKTASKEDLGIEGNCMFKYNGNYYFTGSDLFGWNGSNVYVLQSNSIFGDYNIQPNTSNTNMPYLMSGSASSYAHNSQTGFYTQVSGTEQDLVIFCGDRWSDFAGNGIGYNVWVPVSFDENNTPIFNDLSQWYLDANKGTWSIAPGNNYVHNNEFDADRIIVSKPVGWETSDNVSGAANSNTKGMQSYGTYVWRQYADTPYMATLKQSHDDLPNGTYTLKAWVKSSGGQQIAKLYALSGDKEYNASIKTAMDDWVEIVVKDIKINDNSCEIGIYSDADTGQWLLIDNVSLTRNGQITDTVKPAKPADDDGAIEPVATYIDDANVGVTIGSVSTGTVYAALYSGEGALKEVKTLKNTDKAETIKFEKPLESGCVIKLFHWDNNMVPLSDYGESILVDEITTKVSDTTASFAYDVYSAKKSPDGSMVYSNFIPYRYYLPQNYDSSKKYPIVLYFHGAGSRGDDNESHIAHEWHPMFATLLSEKYLNNPDTQCIMLAPQCPSGRRWVNRDWSAGSYNMADVALTDNMSMAHDILLQFIDEYSVDTDRIYIAGASMGGYGTWRFATEYPELPAAIIPLCGAGPVDAAGAGLIAANEISVWAFHSEDDHTVPSTGTTDMIEAIVKYGSTEYIENVKYNILEGSEHNNLETYIFKNTINADYLQNNALYTWLFNQSRSEN